MAARIYWLDSNVLITAKNGPFRFAVAPAFWKAIESHAHAGTIRISKLVYDEIVEDGREDELARWLKERRSDGFCVTPTQEVQKCLGQIADYVKTSYKSYHAAEFLDVADPWVIAHAMECKGVVVTFETRQPGAKKVKIPNVCDALRVRFMNLFDMMQSLEIRFQ